MLRVRAEISGSRELEGAIADRGASRGLSLCESERSMLSARVLLNVVHHSRDSVLPAAERGEKEKGATNRKRFRKGVGANAEVELRSKGLEGCREVECKVSPAVCESPSRLRANLQAPNQRNGRVPQLWCPRA